MENNEKQISINEKAQKLMLEFNSRLNEELGPLLLTGDDGNFFRITKFEFEKNIRNLTEGSDCNNYGYSKDGRVVCLD